MRGISAIVGTVIFIMVALAFVGLAYIMIDAMTRTTELAREVLSVQAKTANIPLCTTGWWINQTTDLVINITSRCSQAYMITGLTIVFNDTSYLYADPGNGTLTTASVTIAYPTGTVETRPLELPLGVPPGASLNITFTNILDRKTPETITLTVTASPAVAVIPVRYYYDIYQAGNITVITQQAPQAIAAQLQSITGQHTVTWKGQAISAYRDTRRGNVYDTTLLTGTYVSGTPASINQVDGDIYQVTTQRSIEITKNTTIFYDDYSTDPFTTGRIVDATNDWTWDIEKQAIYVNHYVSVLAIYDNDSYGIYSLAYYDPTYLPLTSLMKSLNINSINILYTTWYYGTIQLYSGQIEIGRNTYNSSAEVLYMFSLIYNYNGSDAYIDSFLYAINSTGGTILYEYNVTLLQSTFTGNTNYTFLSLLEPNYKYYRLIRWSLNQGIHNSIVFNETGSTNEPYASVILNEHRFPEANETIGFYVLTYADARPAIIFLFTIPAWAEANITYYFDNLVVTIGDPRFVNVSGVPVGGVVELWDGGVLVARIQDGVNDTDGTADGVVQLPVMHHPISRNAVFTVNDSARTLIINQTMPAPVVGGQEYRLAYWVTLEARSQVNITGLLRAEQLTLYITANVTPTAAGLYVWAYDWGTGGFDPVQCSYLGAGSWSCSLDPARHLNTGNGTVVYRVGFEATNLLTIAVDEANVMLTGVFQASSPVPTLVVGVGGSSVIEVYQVDTATPGLTYLFSMDAGSLFDGSVDVAYSVVDNMLYMVNATGVYRSPLVPGDAWEAVTTACASLGPGVRLEALNTSTTVYLVVVQGNGADQYCVVTVDGVTGAVLQVVAGSIGADLGYQVYTTEYIVSAANDTHMWLLVVNQSNNAPLLVYYTVDTGAFSLLGSAPASRPVGLAYDPAGLLWMLVEAGSLYRINVGDATASLVQVDLPFYPWRPGDRLEHVDGYLLFVRDDDTGEAWFIPVR